MRWVSYCSILLSCWLLLCCVHASEVERRRANPQEFVWTCGSDSWENKACWDALGECLFLCVRVRIFIRVSACECECLFLMYDPTTFRNTRTKRNGHHWTTWRSCHS